MNMSETEYIDISKIEGFVSFLANIDWRDPWLIGLLTFHLSIFMMAMLTRNYGNFQAVLFFLLLLLVYFSENINNLASTNWKIFSRQQYFDSNGLFISVVFSMPILINCMLMVYDAHHKHGMGEEHYHLKRNKKIIKVRRLSSNSPEPGPSRKNTSQTSLLSQINSVFDQAGFGTSDQEEEIQVIDLDRSSNSSDHPIEFLFPKLRQEGVDINFLTRNMPTTDITKLLIGEKAQFTNLRGETKRRHAIDFTPILEVDEAEEEEEDEESWSNESTPTVHNLYRDRGQHYLTTGVGQGGSSADADVSEDESEEAKKEQIRKS